MNSYRDSSSARGKATVPGPPPAGAEADWPGNGGGYAGGPDGPAGLRAPASGSGRASVATRAPAGGDSASGRASVGRAVVNSPSYGDEPSFARTGGRASVGTAVAGRATVGRAAVRPVSPGVPPGPEGPGGPAGPGGGGRGPGGPGRGKPGPAALAKAKRRRRINLIIASFAVLIMIAGGGVVAVTYYSTTVKLPENIALPLSSTIMYAGGKKQIAKVGEVNRSLVKINQIPQPVQHAVASAEDRNFYKHDGIDYLGIARAAWNNVTGGDTQGASTITQQYARNALELEGVTYARKVREAVLASKLSDKYTREQIMEFYLNTIYFGRGAYSIESAAQVYFKKPVNRLSLAEGAVLAAVIKQPVPDKATGHQGYDPALNKEAAVSRWNYVLDGMVEKGWLDAGERQKQKYPAVQPFNEKASCTDCGLNTPAGNVVNYVTREMAELGLCEAGKCMAELRKGGYRVTTSINPDMQAAAEEAAWRKKKDSELAGQPPNLMAALVSIDPNTGRVLAYFGGENSTGFDYAGKNWDKKGNLIGGLPPGSSWKVYTLAAALDNGISLQSHWDARPIRKGAYRVENAGRNPKCGAFCTLEFSTLQSYNVPFFYITEKIGPDKVVDMARAAGITTMWDNDGKPADLLKLKGKDVAPRRFDKQVGFGQYGITVIDHANGLATLAARGVYRKAHFVVTVEQKDPATGKWIKKATEVHKPQERIRPQVVDDVTATLAKIPDQNGDSLDDGRDAAGKTGTWELREGSSENGHAWMVGYTPQVATAVWVGNVGPKQLPIRLKGGKKIGGSDLPADIWKRYMNAATEGMEKLEFHEPANIGDDDAGNGKQPEPTQPTNPACQIPILCPQLPGGEGNRDRDGNGGPGRGPGGGGPNDGPGGGGGGGSPPIILPPPPR